MTPEKADSIGNGTRICPSKLGGTARFPAGDGKGGRFLAEGRTVATDHPRAIHLEPIDAEEPLRLPELLAAV
jgi:hypothetical protein